MQVFWVAKNIFGIFIPSLEFHYFPISLWILTLYILKLYNIEHSSNTQYLINIPQTIKRPKITLKQTQKYFLSKEKMLHRAEIIFLKCCLWQIQCLWLISLLLPHFHLFSLSRHQYSLNSRESDHVSLSTQDDIGKE